MAQATCTQRPMIAALENNADFKVHLVDLRKGEHKQASHLARQPFGVIPALEDGDFSMYESRAMSRYIDDTRGGALTPKDPKKRGVMEQWISLEQGTITPEIATIVSQRIFAPFRGLATDETLVAKAVEKSKQSLDIMDAHLSKNEYLAGDQFSLADAYFLPYFQHLVNTPEKDLIFSRPHLAAWWNRVAGRPSWRKVLTYGQ